MSQGLLLVDKPTGLTSHDAVSLVRRAYGTKRVGHTGTLDPLASGLLIILLGRATRLAQYLVGLDKTYEGIIRLGSSTDTDDTTGEVIETSKTWETVPHDRIRSAMADLTGEIEQVPPRYSAKKLAGEPAHRRVRRGESVSLEPRTVQVHSFQLEKRDGPDLQFVADVGSGTYIRALARDLGKALGSGAHLVSLRRTRVGDFHVRDATALDKLALDPPNPAPSLVAVSHLPKVEIDESARERVVRGRPAEAPAKFILPVALIAGDELIAVAESRGGLLLPRVVLAGWS